jgi:hypothetical protein
VETPYSSQILAKESHAIGAVGNDGRETHKNEYWQRQKGTSTGDHIECTSHTANKKE